MWWVRLIGFARRWRSWWIDQLWKALLLMEMKRTWKVQWMEEMQSQWQAEKQRGQ